MTDREAAAIIPRAITGTLPDTLEECDDLMEAVDEAAWLAKARICQHIRDNKLYLERYDTFEQCCRELWGMSKQHVYRLIDASDVVAHIAESPKGDSQPSKETHARPLAKLPPTEQADAWEEAVEEAKSEGKPVAAHHVEQVVARRRQKREPMKISPDAATPRADRIEQAKRPRLAQTNLNVPHDPYHAARAMRQIFDTDGLKQLKECIDAIIEQQS